MARLIDADKLIKHLAEEIDEIDGPYFLTNEPYMKGIAYGTKLGLKSAISFATTLGDIQDINNVGQKGTNREWLQSLTDDELADFFTIGLMVVPIGLPGFACSTNVREISSRYIQSTLGMKKWLSMKQEFMTIDEWRAQPVDEAIAT